MYSERVNRDCQMLGVYLREEQTVKDFRHHKPDLSEFFAARVILVISLDHGVGHLHR